jgi:hypothetical protein
MIPRMLWRGLPTEQLVCSVVAAGNRLISEGAFSSPIFINSTVWESCRSHATAAGHDWRNSSNTSLGAASSKPAVPKSTNPSATPHSQAIAIMLSKDQMPAEQLRSSMDALSQQLLQNIGSYSSTELSAFTEACRWGSGAPQGKQKRKGSPDICICTQDGDIGPCL